MRDTTDRASPNFVPADERIATFDQDGTLWVEHPMYNQMMYCLDRVPALAAEKPALKQAEPFKTVLSGDRKAISKLTMPELEKIIVATLTGMTTDAFDADVKHWLAAAKDPRWKRPYTELTYQPMLEVMNYFRANGFKTYRHRVRPGFVRIRKDLWHSTRTGDRLGAGGQICLCQGRSADPDQRAQTQVLNDNHAGKPEGIHLMIGRRPYAAFGNSTGDQQMLEYIGAGAGKHPMMLVLHDDAQREYAYGPAQGLPDTKVGTFTQALYDEAKTNRWTVISMKSDWKRIFAFE